MVKTNLLYKVVKNAFDLKNEMNGVLGHLCTCSLNWAGTPLEDGEMTLPSRHRIRNSSPGGLRPSTLHFGDGGSPQY